MLNVCDLASYLARGKPIAKGQPLTYLRSVLLATTDAGLIAPARQAFGATDDYRLVICGTEKEAAERLQEIDVHLFVCDADILGDGPANVVVSARVSQPRVSRVVVASPERAAAGWVVARNAAAYLSLLKPVPAEQIALVAKRALELNELSRRHRLLSREMKISMDDDIFGEVQPLSVRGGFSQFEKLVFASPRMAELATEARQAAATELPVLIHGETGTGKELLARAIHYNSQRMNSPMHVQNCGGMSDDTLHSELFGHVRGAFTGAIADRLGLFRAADGGTVFLDEISEVSPGFQVSLLRFLQGGEVKPLGADKLHTADVRIIAATNRPLEAMVETGQFRRDLYYRLKGFALKIPPLRDRREDIPVLTEYFLEKYAGVVGRRVVGVTKDALLKLGAYDWPGNVREARDRGAADGGDRRPGGLYLEPAPVAGLQRGAGTGGRGPAGGRRLDPEGAGGGAGAQAGGGGAGEEPLEPEPRRRGARPVAGGAREQDQALRPAGGLRVRAGTAGHACPRDQVSDIAV